MTDEVYTRTDLINLHNAYIEEMRNIHIDAAVQYIKGRVLNAVRVGLEFHMIRRIVPLQEWETFASRGVVKHNGLLANESIAIDCIYDIVNRLQIMFPDCHINFNTKDNVLLIGWTL